MQLNSAREISISSSQYFCKLYRCKWVLLEKSLSVVVNIFVNSEDAIESILFHKFSRCKTSSHDNMIQIQEYSIMQVSLTLSFEIIINLIWSSTDVSAETTCIFHFAIRLLFIALINQLKCQRCWRNAMIEEIWRIYCFICRIATREISSLNWSVHEFAKISAIISWMIIFLSNSKYQEKTEKYKSWEIKS
jgi:hypothetical protein